MWMAPVLFIAGYVVYYTRQKWKGSFIPMTKKIKLTIAFIIICIVAFCVLTEMNKARHITVNANTSSINGFYREKKNSIDGIYLGSSPVQRAWIPTQAYEDYGFCIYNMGTTVQPFSSTKYLIKEALKRQKKMKVIFIEVRCLVRPVEHTSCKSFKSITDGMRISSNRNEMIDSYIKYNKSVGADIDYGTMDYYIPITRNYLGWLCDFNFSDLKTLYDDDSRREYKGFYPRMSVEPQKKIEKFDKYAELTDYEEECLQETLEYCKSLDCDVVFTSIPMAGMNFGGSDRLETALKECEEAGFTVLDFNKNPLRDEIDMDWSNDFYNIKHTNYYGAERYTAYLSKWISENYSMPDHRGDSDYESWDKTAKRLKKYVSEQQ